MWSLSEGHEAAVIIWRFNSQTQFGMTMMSLSPDDRYLACGCDQKVEIFELATLKAIRVFEGHSGATCVLWSSDGRYLASCDAHHMRVWEPDDKV